MSIDYEEPPRTGTKIVWNTQNQGRIYLDF
jgi:hypothetical protein